MSTLLVDADVVAYQVAFSTEEAIRGVRKKMNMQYGLYIVMN